MRTVIRSDYEPHNLDYCNKIVWDTTSGKKYIFDCDGVFTTIPAESESDCCEDALAAAKQYTNERLYEKVDKVEGKGLSTNDFTNAYKRKLDNLKAPKTLTISQDGQSISYDTTQDVEVEIAPVDLTNYYTKGEVDELIGAIETGEFVVVDTLPPTGEPKNIYLVPKTGGGYKEYVYVDNAWEEIGDTDIDLSDYYTKAQTDSLLDEKQDTLTAGENITIENNVISATGGGQSYVAGPGIKIQGDTISLDPRTALDALGYQEIELTTTDENGESMSVLIIGKEN